VSRAKPVNDKPGKGLSDTRHNKENRSNDAQHGPRETEVLPQKREQRGDRKLEEMGCAVRHPNKPDDFGVCPE
jgi:hypothetical protein